MYSPYHVDEPLFIDGYDTDSLIKDPKALETLNSILQHRETVKERLLFLADELYKRAYHHDDSKLQLPELQWLIDMDKEPRYAYGTPEYFDKMKRWDKFFKSHYRNNRHHPDHFPNGVNDMNLADLCEYIVDIISYYKELHVNVALDTVNKQQQRFGFDEQLSQILKNTLIEYFSWFGSQKPMSDEQPPTINIIKPSDEDPPMIGLDLLKYYKNKKINNASDKEPKAF